MITVNKDLCIGCGACTALCPDVFQMAADGKSEVISQKNVECAKKAVEGCPVQAIEVK
ncbi:ferredoxin [Candidatus Falkowbacteria bacterium]|nr:ferredoxin [Candidatus Falkowbacteria bacterium]